MKTIVIGLGNPILGDDGAGWKVVDVLRTGLPEGIEIDFLAGGGLSVMERLVGYDRAIIVDTLIPAQAPKEVFQIFSLESLPNPFLGHLGSAHETNLMTALAVGRSLGAYLPDRVTVVGIESPDVYDFGRISQSRNWSCHSWRSPGCIGNSTILILVCIFVWSLQPQSVSSSRILRGEEKAYDIQKLESEDHQSISIWRELCAGF